MSTVGKVLTILVAIPTLIWLWLAAGVAEMNRNWGQAVTKLEQSLETAAKDVRDTAEAIGKLKQDITLSQRERDSEIAALRLQMTRLYKYESISKEDNDRLTFQVANLQIQQDGAQKRYALAEQELQVAQKARDDASAALQVLKTENVRDRQTLADLQGQFQKLLAENLAMVQEALQAEQARSRPASAGVSR